MIRSLRVLGFLAVCGLASTPAYAETNIFVVLDGSNSMWGQVDGKAKIESALGTLYETIDDFPGNANAGLVAYGHREEKNCSDVQTLLPLKKVNRQSFIDSTADFTPRGKTPIAQSLEYTAAQFKNNDANNNIVLISDGIETCGGDPCGTIKRLRNDEGLNVDVHVIGFDIDKEAYTQLKCIADAGNGTFITADSNQGLEKAFAEVAETVKVREKEFAAKQKPKAESSDPVAQVLFEESFDNALSESDWIIAEEKSQFHSSGDGALSLAGDKTIQNVFMLNKDLPEGDWQAVIDVAYSLQTGYESFSLGVYQDKDNYVFSEVVLDHSPDDIDGRFYSKFGGKVDRSGDVELISVQEHCRLEDDNGNRIHGKDYSECRNNDLALKEFLKDNVGHIKLVKRGQFLTAYGRFEYEFDKDWVKIGEFPLFKEFGKIAFRFDSGSSNMSSGRILNFRLETLKDGQ